MRDRYRWLVHDLALVLHKSSVSKGLERHFSNWHFSDDLVMPRKSAHEGKSGLHSDITALVILPYIRRFFDVSGSKFLNSVWYPLVTHSEISKGITKVVAGVRIGVTETYRRSQFEFGTLADD